MINKNKAAILLGTFLEWFEYGYYAYIATHIAKLYFPQKANNASLLYAYGIFALGYFFRPIGAIIFGHIGDTWGRKKALYYSIMIMAAGSLGLGLLPTYEKLGSLSIYLLLIFRCMQGIAVSGEFNGGCIFVVEHEKTVAKYFAGSLSGVFASLGLMASAFCSLLVSLVNYEHAWRVPFFMAGIGCFLARYLRSNIDETFLHSKKLNKCAPIKGIFKSHKPQILIGIILSAYVSVNVYVGSMYYSTILEANTILSSSFLKGAITFGQFCIILFLPMFGKISDRYNPFKTVMIGLVGAGIVFPLNIWFAQQESVYLIFVGQILYGFFDAMAGAPIFYMVFKLFPSYFRYTGYSFSWSIGAAFFGSTSLIISKTLTNICGIYGSTIYHFAIISLTLLTVLNLKESKSVQMACSNDRLITI